MCVCFILVFWFLFLLVCCMFRNVWWNLGIVTEVDFLLTSSPPKSIPAPLRELAPRESKKRTRGEEDCYYDKEEDEEGVLKNSRREGGMISDNDSSDDEAWLLEAARNIHDGNGKEDYEYDEDEDDEDFDAMALNC